VQRSSLVHRDNFVIQDQELLLGLEYVQLEATAQAAQIVPYLVLKENSAQLQVLLFLQEIAMLDITVFKLQHQQLHQLLPKEHYVQQVIIVKLAQELLKHVELELIILQLEVYHQRLV